MPDDVAITAGTGTTVRTDQDGSSRHHQAVKVTLGADGTFREFADGSQKDAAGYAMWVEPRPRTGKQTQDSAGLTTATTAYTAGDILGNEFTFTSMASASGGRGRITGVVLLDDGDVIENVDVFLMNAATTFGSDNAAPTVTDTEAAKIVGLIGLGVAADLGGARLLTAHSIAVPYDCSGGTSLYARLVTRTGHTFFTATDDLHLTLFYEQD